METMLTAIEMTATIDEHRQLQLDDTLPISGPLRVKVIMLYPLVEGIDESDWLRAATHNPAFAYLRDSAEDIYTVDDGKPFNAEE